MLQTVVRGSWRSSPGGQRRRRWSRFVRATAAAGYRKDCARAPSPRQTPSVPASPAPVHRSVAVKEQGVMRAAIRGLAHSLLEHVASSEQPRHRVMAQLLLLTLPRRTRTSSTTSAGAAAHVVGASCVESLLPVLLGIDLELLALELLLCCDEHLSWWVDGKGSRVVEEMGAVVFQPHAAVVRRRWERSCLNCIQQALHWQQAR
jgi:hypothetical protein